MLLNGEGRQVTAGTTAVLLTFGKAGANSVSVDVEGVNDVYILVNTTKAAFDAAYTAGTTIKVRAGLQFAFVSDGLQNISSIVYYAPDGDSALNIAAY